MSLSDILKDIASSNFLPAYSKAIHIRYVTVAKMLLKSQGVLLLSGKLEKDALVANTFGITHLDDSRLYTSSEEDILFMIQAANAFVKNDHKLVTFLVNFFYRKSKGIMDELQVRFFE